MQTRPTILFASWHFYLDRTNGASISTRELLLELARRGWQVRTLCFSSQDGLNPAALNELARRSGFVVEKTIARGDYSFSSFNDNGIRSIVVVPRVSRRTPSPSDVAVYLGLLKDLLSRGPSIVLTYGGYCLGPKLLAASRAAGASTCVFLHNLSYRDRNYFNGADLVFVPSQYASDVYRDRLGIETVVAPPLIALKNKPGDLDSCFARPYILFVNPEIGKGACIFLALAREFERLCPDVRFLAVEGRAGSATLLSLGKKYQIDVSNIDFVPNTDSMAGVYEHTKLTLVPSLYEETFGRVAAESLSSGIPVISSTRGALPEVVGDGGVLIDVPLRFTIDIPVFPMPEELRPWFDALRLLWDDRAAYAVARRSGLERARRWSFAETADIYEAKLVELIRRHGECNEKRLPTE